MAISLPVYCAISITALALSLTHAVMTREQFYNVAIYMSSAKLNILVRLQANIAVGRRRNLTRQTQILGNAMFMNLLLFAKVVVILFLGDLRALEVEGLVENAKYAILETCLALTIFRDDLDLLVAALFVALLFCKLFHWLAYYRVDLIARRQGVLWLTHIRIQGLIAFLSLIDILFVAGISYRLLFNRGPAVLLLFAIEFAILSVSVVSTMLQYILLMVDNKMEGRWENKPTYTFIIEVSMDLIRLLLYLAFFMIVSSLYGLPIHLIRELYVAFNTLHQRVRKFVRYRRIVKNLRERFPDASRAELAEADQCIICREHLDAAKKLPCGHLFHFHCLRTWLQRSNTCPTCRGVIPDQLVSDQAAAPQNPVDAPVHQAPHRPGGQMPAPSAAAFAPSPQTVGVPHFHLQHLMMMAKISTSNSPASSTVPGDKASIEQLLRVLGSHTFVVENALTQAQANVISLRAYHDHLLTIQQQLMEAQDRCNQALIKTSESPVPGARSTTESHALVDEEKVADDINSTSGLRQRRPNTSVPRQ